MTRIAVIDYDIGNVKSIINALEKVGANILITRDEKAILSADGVVLPGVGAFSHGMKKLQEYGLDRVLKKFDGSGVPLLGICLGMQMLFTESEEFGDSKGLDIIKGKVLRLRTLNPRFEKLPHVSWNEIHSVSGNTWDKTILEGLGERANMYFVHTFAAVPASEEDILSVTSYSDYAFCSSVRKGNVYGCQFHPEKSAVEGLSIIRNFVKICEEQ